VKLYKSGMFFEVSLLFLYPLISLTYYFRRRLHSNPNTRLMSILSQFIKSVLVFTLYSLSCLGTLSASTPEYKKDSTAISELIQSSGKKSLKNFPESINDATKAIELAKKLNDKEILVKTYLSIGLIYEDNTRLETAASYYQMSLDLFDLVNKQQQIDIVYNWAIINKKLNRFKIARDFYNKTLSLALQADISKKGIKDFQSAQMATNGLGTLHEFLGEFDLAINAYLQSLEYAKQCNNVKGSVLTLVNISGVYLKGKDYNLALENITKAMNMANELKDTTHIGFVYVTFGKILNEQGKYEDALSYLTKALKHYESKGEKRYIARTYIHISEVYLQKKDFHTAKEYLLKAVNNYKDALQFDDYPNLYLKLGTLYQQTNQNVDAAKALNEAIESAKTRNFKEIIQKANTVLSEVYAQLGNHQLALEALKTANIFGDSLFNEKKSRQFAEAQYKFDVEKAEEQSKFQKELGEKKLNDVKLEQSRYMFVMFFLFFSAIIGTLVYIVKIKTKSNAILLQKNDEIKFQNERLEKSNEILSQFAYASAHDLKEPLRSISSFVHIIQRRYSKILPPEADEYMNFVIGGVKRMESLLGALLEYSTVASNQQEVKQVTPLNHALNDILQNLHTIINEKGAVIDIPNNLPSMWISRLHLTQLFQNLMSNSMKFSDKPPRIEITGRVKDEQYVIAIKDNGIGMKAEYGDKIFRLFQRLSRNPEYEGTGIGLAICKNIVDNYNGKIWFESTEGVGTTFFISVPLAIVKFEKENILNTINTEGVTV
jgi:signal transduction histidine kinase